MTAPQVPEEAPEEAPGGVLEGTEQSREDTDADWGEYPEPDHDRLYRDRPPHWDDY